MMKHVWTYVWLSTFLLSFSAQAQIDREEKVTGSLETGIWYLSNNISDFEDDGTTYTAQDDYGNAYVQDDYTLFHARLKLDTGEEDQKFRFHTQGRFLYNIKDQNYTLGINERYRYQFKEFNIELNGVFGSAQIFLGRKTNYHAGGIAVDGLTLIFEPQKDWNLGLYTGLGVDPRQFTGYIGPDYRENPINLDFYTSGVFSSLRKEKFQLDFAINSLLYEFSVDRINVFSHFMAHLHDRWSISGLLDVGAAGDTGLIQAQAFIHTKVTSKITNQFGYHRFRSIYFDQSNASGIPVPNDINPNFDLGNNVNTTYYQSFSNHTKFKLQKNYVFTNLSYAKRDFDDRTRKSFSIGYRDPNIQKSNIHATLKTSLIDNYKSYHVIVDLMTGTDIIEQTLEFEVGGSVSYNERQAFQNFQPIDGQFETEQESMLRANLIYQPTLKMGWYLQYRMYNQVDAVNLDQKVKLHEIFLSTNLRF